MNQKKKQNPFWHLAGPLLGYWVIQLVAEIIVSMLVMLPYAAKYLSLVMNHASEMNYTDVVNKYYMETMQPGLELVLKYATEINSSGQKEREAGRDTAAAKSICQKLCLADPDGSSRKYRSNLSVCFGTACDEQQQLSAECTEYLCRTDFCSGWLWGLLSQSQKR